MLVIHPRPPISTLFPYTTLFRSEVADPREWKNVAADSNYTSVKKDLAQWLPKTNVPTPGAAEKGADATDAQKRSEEHTSELQSLRHLVCRLLLEKKKRIRINIHC